MTARVKRWNWPSLIGLLAMALGLLSPLVPAWASDTPNPTSVGIPGDYQQEVGCAGDWDPSCGLTQLAYDAFDDKWQASWAIPAGVWQYKAALNNSWDENYGAGGVLSGENLPLNLAAETTVKFYYDHETHWITSNQNAVIATIPGSFQDELGCGGDWQPDCLRSWLQDPDGNGIYSFSTTALPAGPYEAKVAINEGWAENYGVGGVPGGANYAFTVPVNGQRVDFAYDSLTHELAITMPPPGPSSVTIAGSLQSELGCPGDWDAACAATHLAYDFGDDVWQQVFNVPAGSWEYKATLNDSWTENYGLNATRDGANLPLNLAAETAVKFYYDHETHWITSNQNAVIATVPGSFQDELGCGGDWQPDCLRSWLQDPDGNGIYSFSTTALPAGPYEAKVAINEGWAENYGVGGVPGGANIPFTVPAEGVEMIFSYDPLTHVLSITASSQSFPDNNVEWDGVRHDSRDLLYRTPGGAVPSGTAVTLRLRTFHNDVTNASLRMYSVNDGGQQIIPMGLAAEDVSCYQAGLEYRTCDFWEVAFPAFEAPDNFWYRFVVTDGSDTDYYADDTRALDGGMGAVSDDIADNSFALMVYDPAFSAPQWTSSAVIYQIFPDRFRNGSTANDPQTGDVRYDDPVLALPWGTLPEGYCRNYADGSTNCPWRFDDTPPDWSPTKEAPRGRDYFGGDLKGVEQKIPYLKSLGVTTIYFNPTFTAKSNHRYDTADYYQIDPALGSMGDFQSLLRTAQDNGIRVILDGVFNHMSSDSPFFDRYGYYGTVGACESLDSPYRDWFYFHDVAAGSGVCAGSAGPNSATYDGWFGFDSIPVINKNNPEVQGYFINNDDSVTRFWLEKGTAGWRQDVMGDASFPNGYWEQFREVAKTTSPDSVIIGELWQKDSTLLRFLRGDRADTTMNYRLRDAVLGLLSPGPFDSKGFGDSGRVIEPSEFAARILSIREDYPDAAYYSLMNLLGSHDTERLLWAMTPGTETTLDKELNAANVAEGKRRQQMAALIQYTMPGAPTVYYGDEAGVTGDDDPDDRRTYPWNNPLSIDKNMLTYYANLASVRRSNPALVSGDIRALLADDAADTLAYGRKTARQAAVVAINRSAEARTLQIPVAGYLPEGMVLNKRYGVGGISASSATVSGGILQVSLEPMSAWLLATSLNVDLNPPAAPAGLVVLEEGSMQVSLGWGSVPGAAGYNIYRSPLSGGGWIKINETSLAGTSYTDTGLENAHTYYYVATAVDAAGNESALSNEASAMPHYTIGWANLQWPPSMQHVISAIDRTDTAYGQVWIDGATSAPGPTDGLAAQLGFGPHASDPAGTDWIWVDAGFNVDAGNNDEFMASMLPEVLGGFDYVFRYSTTNGRDWLYADLSGPISTGSLPANPGILDVLPSADSTPPATPNGLVVVSASPAGVSLAWDALLGDDTLYGYEVRRSDTPGGPYATLALVTDATYLDTNVVQGATYYYVVRAVDTSFNRSGDSAEVMATAELRSVSVIFNVTVPDTTDATGFSVYIAGTLDRLDGGLPSWNPGGVVLSRLDATHWTITLTGMEATQIEYKYALGSWDYVEKGAACDEVANRQLTLSYGTTGTQMVNDVVLNWRNVLPCGN